MIDTSNTNYFSASMSLMFSSFYSSQDPLPEHFEASREIINADCHSFNWAVRHIDKGVDLLARELVIACSRFKEKVESIEEEQISEIFLRIFDYTIQDMLWIDAIFFDFLASFGQQSAFEVEIQRSKSKERFLKWHNTSADDIGAKIWSLWSLSDVEEQASNMAPRFLYILAYGLWHDVIKQRWEKHEKNVPALTMGALMTTVKPCLLKGSKTELRGEYL